MFCWCEWGISPSCLVKLKPVVSFKLHGLLLREIDCSYVTNTVHTAGINIGQNSLCGDDYHNGQYTYNWLASYLRRAQCQ